MRTCGCWIGSSLLRDGSTGADELQSVCGECLNVSERFLSLLRGFAESRAGFTLVGEEP